MNIYKSEKASEEINTTGFSFFINKDGCSETSFIEESLINSKPVAEERAKGEYLANSYHTTTVMFKTFWREDIRMNKIIELEGFGVYIIDRIEEDIEEIKSEMTVYAKRYD